MLFHWPNVFQYSLPSESLKRAYTSWLGAWFFQPTVSTNPLRYILFKTLYRIVPKVQ